MNVKRIKPPYFVVIWFAVCAVACLAVYFFLLFPPPIIYPHVTVVVPTLGSEHISTAVALMANLASARPPRIISVLPKEGFVGSKEYNPICITLSSFRNEGYPWPRITINGVTLMLLSVGESAPLDGQHQSKTYCSPFELVNGYYIVEIQLITDYIIDRVFPKQEYHYEWAFLLE